jgi:hypothetical protein
MRSLPSGAYLRDPLATPGARCTGPGHERNLLSPSCGDLPVGRFVGRAVESFFSDFPKNICCHLTQIKSTTLASHPTRGAYRDRHGRGVRMRWTRQRFARDGIAGRVGERPVSDHQASGRGMLQRTVKSCGPDASTLASSLAEARSAQPSWTKPSIRRATVAKEPDRRGATVFYVNL